MMVILAIIGVIVIICTIAMVAMPIIAILAILYESFITDGYKLAGLFTSLGYIAAIIWLIVPHLRAANWDDTYISVAVTTGGIVLGIIEGIIFKIVHKLRTR